MVLVPLLRHGASPTRVRRLRELVGVSRRTVERWCRWWRSGFVETPFWRLAWGRFAQPMTHAALPSSLLERFAGDEAGEAGGPAEVPETFERGDVRATFLRRGGDPQKLAVGGMRGRRLR